MADPLALDVGIIAEMRKLGISTVGVVKDPYQASQVIKQNGEVIRYIPQYISMPMEARNNTLLYLGLGALGLLIFALSRK